MNDKDDLIAKYSDLVRRVVADHFAYTSPPSQSADYDDLVQEGFLALCEASDIYDTRHPSGVPFDVYAAAAIHNRLVDYCDLMATPISVGSQRDVFRRGSEQLQDKYESARNCKLFSESLVESISPGDQASRRVGESRPSDPISQMINTEYASHCLAKLREQLNTYQFTILVDRAMGATYRSLGKDRGICHETARQRAISARKRALSILEPLNTEREE